MTSHTMLRPEIASDQASVRELHKRAFGGTKVPALVDALRQGTAALRPLSFVAEQQGRIVGHVMLSASRLGAPARLVDVYVLSPLGVFPEHQRQVIGTVLIDHAARAADQAVIPLVFLESDPSFYGLRGFERASSLGFRSASLRIPDAAFQVRRLGTCEPWMTGTLVYADAFWATDCVGLRNQGVHVGGVKEGSPTQL